jgi:hypothetical protein
MKTKLLGCLATTVMAAAIAVATPAMAFHGGGGFGGFHGGFGGGGFRGGFVAAVSVAAWSPAGARSSPVETALPAHTSPAGMLSSIDVFSMKAGATALRIVSATGVFSSMDSITSRSLAYRSLTATPRTGMVAGAGMAGSGLTSAISYN